MIKLVNGKSQLLYQNYTYYRHYVTKSQIRWSCTSNCKAYLKTDVSLVVKKLCGEHSHQPKFMHKTQDGIYVTL
uniref:FLYWCH-type domain-containing protein n=1 Tax=Pararge aegeria TaxID=116150 RepID=S4NL62_9NEOP